MNILIVDFLKTDCYVTVVFCNCNLKFWTFCSTHASVSHRCSHGYACYSHKHTFKL